MMSLTSRVPGVHAHGLPAWWAAVAVLAIVITSCGTEAPVELLPAPPAAPAPADDGTAQIVGSAPPSNGAVGSVILLDPHADIEVALPDEVPVMDQYGRMFYPLFLVVRKGQIVRFTNSEDELHTVHVKDSAGESLFNISTLFGSSYEFTFDRDDWYDVECNTHTEMAADILVVSSPYAVLADRDGAFTMPDVIPGTYTVTLLNGEDRREREIEIVAGRNELDLTGQ